MIGARIQTELVPVLDPQPQCCGYGSESFLPRWRSVYFISNSVSGYGSPHPQVRTVCLKPQKIVVEIYVEQVILINTNLVSK